MGIFFSQIFNSLFGTKECRILILGLDNAGKTTILYKLQGPDEVQTIPTIGFEVETLMYKNIKFQVWDLGGQTAIRPYWRCYYPNTDAIVYVVDSADRNRINDSKDALFDMLSEEELKDTVLLVFANKKDIAGAMTSTEVATALDLAKIKNRSWFIQATSAVNREGLFEGFDWLVSCYLFYSYLLLL